jgi:hypothetical protein
MIPRGAFFVIVCTTALASSGVSAADAYRSDQFLGLDLSQAVLSPKPLGPATEFAPVAVEAQGDVKGDRNSEAWWARHELNTEPRKVAVQKVRAARIHTTVAQLRSDKPHGAARTRLARRHGNPLNAQAFDMRIQVWPCRSGGICDWKPTR